MKGIYQYVFFVVCVPRLFITIAAYRSIKGLEIGRNVLFVNVICYVTIPMLLYNKLLRYSAITKQMWQLLVTDWLRS